MEGTETVDIQLQAFPPGNLETVIGNQGTASLEILDNEVSYIEFTQAVYTAIESDQLFPNLATITLSRIGNVNNPANVDVLLAGGSAEEGSDYSSFGVLQNVYFEPGQETQTLEIDIIDDFDLEGTETLELQLQTFPGNPEIVIADQGTAILDILDNEVSYVEFV